MSRAPAPAPHPLLDRWLSGTTCYRYWIARSVLFENAEYIVFKHGSYADYCGRFYDNTTCRAYAALYRKAELLTAAGQATDALLLGDGAVRRWEGRISRQRILADCRQQGIEFPDGDTQ